MAEVLPKELEVWLFRLREASEAKEGGFNVRLMVWVWTIRNLMMSRNMANSRYYANDQLELGVAYELARVDGDSEMVDFVYDQMSPDREVIARANDLPEGVKGIISDYLFAVDTN